MVLRDGGGVRRSEYLMHEEEDVSCDFGILSVLWDWRIGIERHWAA